MLMMWACSAGFVFLNSLWCCSSTSQVLSSPLNRRAEQRELPLEGSVVFRYVKLLTFSFKAIKERLN